jgi:hypothetical protein
LVFCAWRPSEFRQYGIALDQLATLWEFASFSVEVLNGIDGWLQNTRDQPLMTDMMLVLIVSRGTQITGHISLF